MSRKLLNPAGEDSLVGCFKGTEEKSSSGGTEKAGPSYSQWFKEPQMLLSWMCMLP